MTHENDLIRRGDAIAILSAASRTAQKTIDAIAALEAAPHVNETPKIEHDNADVLTAVPAPVTLAGALQVPEVRAKRDDLQAKLGAAADALDECQRALHDHMVQYPHMVKGYTVDAEERARTTLAKIKGADK